MTNKQEYPKQLNSHNKPTKADNVNEWLEKQGYSLEMRVAKKFRDADFKVSQFEHYIDQESQSVRPIDVVASNSRDIKNSTLNLKVFVECKYVGEDRAWVIITTSEKFDKYMYFSRVLRNNHPANWKAIETLQGRLVGKLLQFAEGKQEFDFFTRKTAGYIVRQAFVEKHDYAYEAIVEIGKSVEAHDSENEKFYKKTLEAFEQSENLNSPPHFGLYLSLAIPIVVINGELYESSLAEGGQIETRKIEHGIVLVPYRRREYEPNAQVTLSSVAIVTEVYLDSYVKDLKIAFEGLLSNDEAIEDMVAYEQYKVYNPLTSDDIEF
jgi:hypothetical protein